MNNNQLSDFIAQTLNENYGENKWKKTRKNYSD